MAGAGRKKGGTATAREKLCRRCGVCCHEKVRFGETILITDIPCRFLDPAGRRCRVYPDRLSRQPRCSTAEASLRAGTLPGDCPYVRETPDYRPPLLLSRHPEFETAVRALFPGKKCAKST
ncbi:MAG: hypothetical protein LBU64_14520 [Planctomycetota bacterium]|jgi:uncharacterized cysteine cluster protein YcgN (CxxCxxCC family)|nr:hypothetical protein [Planctomycetota bacterium]